MARHIVVPLPAPSAPLTGARSRARVARLGRYALGVGYAAYFVSSYRRRGFLFDRERVMLWIAAALVITSVGRAWRWALRVAAEWVPFAVLLYAYDRSYSFPTEFGRPVLVAPLVGADKLLFAGYVPAVWVQQHISHRGGVGWWELAVSIVYASHFVLPFALAGALWWRSRRLWRQWVTRLLTLSFSAVIVYAALPTGAPWYAAQKGLGFALADGRTRVVTVEIAVAAAFIVLAAAGVTASAWRFVLGYAGHGPRTSGRNDTTTSRPPDGGHPSAPTSTSSSQPSSLSRSPPA